MNTQPSSAPSPPSGGRPRSNGDSSTRRGFFALALGWSASGLALLASGVAGLRSLIPNVLFEPSRRYKAGRPGDYPDNTFTFIEEVRLFVVRNGNNYRAVSAVCPHLGCTVNLTPGRYPFLCPCHGSHFDRSGAAMTGPAPKGLAWYALHLSKDGRLMIDMDREVDPSEQLTITA